MDYSDRDSCPFFSIVIVNYNHGRFLESAIQSILSQDFDSYEIILVDGGSNDCSQKIIQKYKNKFSWWISERDSGQSSAFNKGFKHARGEFFFWLNADDLLLQGTLNKVYEKLMINKKCVWLAANTIVLDERNVVKWCIRGPVTINSLMKNGTVYIYGPSSFFHRSLFRTVGGFDEKLHYTMDTDLWYRFINMGYSFERLNYYAWGLRVHEASKTSHAFSSGPNQKFINEQKYIQEKNNHYIYWYIELAQTCLKIISGVFFVKLVDNFLLKRRVI